MRTCAALLIVPVLTTVLTAQEFEVASVKPALSDRSIGDMIRRAPPGQWKSFGSTLESLIINAYPEFRLPGLLIGGPDWMRETKFDLQARMSPTATPADVQVMTRRLLEQRFGLRTHVERRTLDVFVLTLAEAGKTGPGLTPSNPVCTDWQRNGGGVPADCDLRRKGIAAEFTTSAATMGDFITMLMIPSMMTRGPVDRFVLDRPIVDRTGLNGYFQIVGPSPMASNPSFLSEMEQQYGLKLTRAREAVNVLVVDAASLPEPD